MGTMDTIASMKYYFSTLEGVRLAVLFGSHARGTARPNSDVDLGIGFYYTPDLLELGGIIDALGNLTGKKIDLVELDGLPAANPLLAFNIASEARLLAETEPGAWLAFRNRACLQYFDLEEFLARQRLELESRLESGSFGRAIHA
jgi:predicted nucleotidyltransferase